MLPRKIFFSKTQNTQDIHAKLKEKKNHPFARHTKWLEDKENINGNANRIPITVDMTKKIKKVAKEPYKR